MSRKKGITPGEITALLQELPDNDSEGGELSEYEEEIEEINTGNNSSSDSDTDEEAHIKSDKGRDNSSFSRWYTVVNVCK